MGRTWFAYVTDPCGGGKMTRGIVVTSRLIFDRTIANLGCWFNLADTMDGLASVV